MCSVASGIRDTAKRDHLGRAANNLAVCFLRRTIPALNRDNETRICVYLNINCTKGQEKATCYTWLNYWSEHRPEKLRKSDKYVTLVGEMVSYGAHYFIRSHKYGFALPNVVIIL